MQRRDEAQVGFMQKLIGFFGWVFTGFGLFKNQKSRMANEEVTVYAVHQSFFVWLLVLVGFVGAPIVHHWPGNENVSVAFGWIYLWVLLYTLITLIYDLNTIKFLLWIGIFTLIWLAMQYVQDVKAIPLVNGLVAYFHLLKPHMDPGFVTVVRSQ